MFARHHGQGAFYALMPHGLMALLFGAPFLCALIALAMGARNFRRDIGWAVDAPVETASFGRAATDAATLRYLDGGGMGCAKEEEKTDRRRFFHHLAFYGFLLCFAATSVATLEHYLLGRQAPYPWYEPPVLLGTAGGLGLIIGPVGLLLAKWKRDVGATKETRHGVDVAFLAMLILTSLTGFALLFLRSTSAMGLLLALHLGLVLALFLTLPYGKFVHGLYRYLALSRYAQDRRELAKISEE